LNVCMHLKALLWMQEQLAGMEASLTDDDFVTIILGSLLKSYRQLINTISLSSAIAQTQLKPDAVVSSLLDEYERLKIKERQLKAAKSALAAAKDVARENALVTTLPEAAPTAAKPTLNAGIVARKVTYEPTASQRQKMKTGRIIWRTSLNQVMIGHSP